MARILWTQRQDIGPDARAGAAMTFDTGRSRTVLFGGRTSAGVRGDTWEWNGGLWTQAQDIGPAARESAAMAHGSAGVILFGGSVAARDGGSIRGADTWSWDGSDWTQVADTGPSARSRTALVFDAARSQYVLFGGAGDTGALDDTWVYDGSDWTQVADTGPTARSGHAMAYDAARQRVVLYGGLLAEDFAADTWTWDGSEWTQAEDEGPGGRDGHVMVGDGSSVWLFGGESHGEGAAIRLLGDTWEWDGSAWTQRQDMGPNARTEAAAAFDPGRGRMVLYGGTAKAVGADAPAPAGDTWEVPTAAAVPAGPQGPQGPPEPQPGQPPQNTITVDASARMIKGSSLGFVTVTASVPAGVDRTVTVTTAGVQASLASTLRSGQTSVRAFFRMPGDQPATVSVDVSLGELHAPATVSVVEGRHLTAFAASIGDPAQAAPLSVHVEMDPMSISAEVASIASMTSGEEWEQVTIPQLHGETYSQDPLPAAVSSGVHHLAALLKQGTDWSVSGPAIVQVP